jgi:cobyrinic acid a,c-diamide synthase
VPVLGALRRSDSLAVPERHLGLVPAAERQSRNRELLAALAEAVGSQVDLDAVVALARSAPDLPGASWSPEPAGDRSTAAGRSSAGAGPDRPVRIAVAEGPAFSFHYEENLELLGAAGAELVGFDPTVDEHLPDGSGAMILAGGFPEVYGAELAANGTLKREIAEFTGPILAECGGLLYLGQQLDEHQMCGRLALKAQMTGRLRLGYREATAVTSTPWMDEGSHVRGHEFHYSEVDYSSDVAPAWALADRGPDGVVSGQVQAGYLHVNWAAHPEIPQRFVEAAWH